VSRKLLAGRLERLARGGVLERRPYQDNPVRHDYLLTDKGKELVSAFFALMAWGDRWTAGEAGPPMRLRHDCGALATPEITCSECGEPLTAERVTPEPGPGARIAHGTTGIARVFARPR
jgi:hypothetical protein